MGSEAESEDNYDDEENYDEKNDEEENDEGVDKKEKKNKKERKKRKKKTPGKLELTDVDKMKLKATNEELIKIIKKETEDKKENCIKKLEKLNRLKAELDKKPKVEKKEE